MSFDMHTTLEYSKNLDTPAEALHEIFFQLAREIKMAGGAESKYTTDKDGVVTEVKRTGQDASRLGEIVSWLETQGASVATGIITAQSVKHRPSQHPFVAEGPRTAAQKADDAKAGKWEKANA